MYNDAFAALGKPSPNIDHHASDNKSKQNLWSTVQVGGAQSSSMVHNIVLHSWDGAQRPTNPDWRMDEWTDGHYQTYSRPCLVQLLTSHV